MGSWGINPKASKKEKIKSEMADHLAGLNAVGEIDYKTYSDTFDVSMRLLDEMYELGKEEANNESQRTDSYAANI